MIVGVSGEESGMTGTSYSMTCTVRLPPGVTVAPIIQWKRHNMTFTPASVTLFFNRDYLATLQLLSLQSSDAGEYLCQARYSLGGYTSPLVNYSFTLNLTGKPKLQFSKRAMYHYV